MKSLPDPIPLFLKHTYCWENYMFLDPVQKNQGFEPSLTSHTLRRVDGSGHTATIELLALQKLAVTNQICTALFLDRIHCYGVAIMSHV